jgi:1-acyl-sn-glycerol-3-phosphate acyltransferase
MLSQLWFVKENGGLGWPARQRCQAAAQGVLHLLGRTAIQLGARAMLRLDIVRHAPLPRGPKIMAPNHPTTSDPFLIMMLLSEQMSILIDDRLFKVPLFGRCLRLAGHVPVVPGHGHTAYAAAKRLLEEGRTLSIFPEGAISPLDGSFHHPRTGIARLALSTGVPVIPVGIHLQRERIRLIKTNIEGKAAVGTWYLSGPYAITIGKPIYFEGDVQDRAHVRSISEQIMQRIISLAHESADRITKADPCRLPISIHPWLGELPGGIR